LIQRNDRRARIDCCRRAKSIRWREDGMVRLNSGAARRSIPLAVALIAVTLHPSQHAAAQSYHRGIVEYEVACLPCHGIDGRGDGPQAKALQVRPADLTRIARANKGRFPTRRIAAIIDGRAIVASHGKRAMPVWGERYKVVLPGESAATAEKRVRAQIAVLIDYLKSIQE
jgi:hypothetical protein